MTPNILLHITVTSHLMQISYVLFPVVVNTGSAEAHVNKLTAFQTCHTPPPLAMIAVVKRVT